MEISGHVLGLSKVSGWIHKRGRVEALDRVGGVRGVGREGRRGHTHTPVTHAYEPAAAGGTPLAARRPSDARCCMPLRASSRTVERAPRAWPSCASSAGKVHTHVK